PAGFTPALGTTFVIVNNDGADAVNGTFVGLPEGGGILSAGTVFQISYVGGTGNDITLTAALGLSVDDVTVPEGDSGTGMATFSVRLSSAAAGTVTVDYATVDGTAIAPTHYTAKTGTLTFNPGEIFQKVSVKIGRASCRER